MKKFYNAILGVAATTIVAGATMVPANVFAYGDSNNGRNTYTIEQINAGALGNNITFNSITNGKIGNEINFVGAKSNSENAGVWEQDEINVKDGETYTIRLYVHNNSPLGVNAIAKNVSANFSLPTTVAKSQDIIGYINSSNANPTTYWDEVKLVSSNDFYIEYVKGSAKYTNAKLGTVALSDDVIVSGATIGYDALNGEIPGCYEYDGHVSIEVKVHNSITSKLSKTVRLKGTRDWQETVDAKVGDEVEYQIEYVNLAAESVENVMIRDILPNNMEYVSGSTYLYNITYQDGARMLNDDVVKSGINIGGYAPQGNAYVRFTAKVINKDLVCGNNQLVNWASATVNSAVFKDDASVMVAQSENCRPKQSNTNVDTGANVSSIVNTGPAEVAGAALGAGSLVTALGYFIASRKKLM